MTLQVYRTTGFCSRSVLRAALVAEVNTREDPEDPQAFADEYDGDFIEPASAETGGEDELTQ